MLLIQCLISITGLLFLLSPLVSPLPVPLGDMMVDSAVMFANKPVVSEQWPSSMDLSEDQQPFTSNDTPDFDVDLNRFTQLLSAHIMSEHLDSAITALSKKLAGQIQDSIQLITNQQVFFPNIAIMEKVSPATDDVDVRLLKEQLQGAVGSYVQDQLPSLWYNHRSFVALDSISLRSFMETTLLVHCPIADEIDSRGMIISHRCLQPLAAQFSATLDTYVKNNMQSALADIVQQDLPQLLAMTDNHVRAILNHFNTFLLPPHSQLRMNLLSLQDHQDWSSIDHINTILDSITASESKDVLVHSIQRYALLAKSTASST